jgi:hypothetical protein
MEAGFRMGCEVLKSICQQFVVGSTSNADSVNQYKSATLPPVCSPFVSHLARLPVFVLHFPHRIAGADLLMMRRETTPIQVLAHAVAGEIFVLW